MASCHKGRAGTGASAIHSFVEHGPTSTPASAMVRLLASLQAANSQILSTSPRSIVRDCMVDCRVRGCQSSAALESVPPQRILEYLTHPGNSGPNDSPVRPVCFGRWRELCVPETASGHRVLLTPLVGSSIDRATSAMSSSGKQIRTCLAQLLFLLGRLRPRNHEQAAVESRRAKIQS